MRHIKLTGREASVIRAIGFAEALSGAEVQEHTHMDAEDVLDTLNSLISAGFVEPAPYCDQVELEQMHATAFEMNPAYAHDLKSALHRR